MMRALLIILLFSFSMLSFSQKKKEAWQALNEYRSLLSDSSATTNQLDQSRSRVDSALKDLYNRKILFINNPPKEEIASIERYRLSTSSFENYECDNDLSEEYFFTNDLHSHYVSPDNILDYLIDGQSTLLSLKVEDKDPSKNPGITTNIKRLRNTTIEALKYIQETNLIKDKEIHANLITVLEEFRSLQFEMNQSENQRLNHMISYLERRAYENCEIEKHRLRMQMEEQYALLKSVFAKFQYAK